MRTTTLRVKTPPGFRVDAAGLLPAALASLSVAEIERVALPGGNERCLVGDVFEVSRNDAPAAGDDMATLVIDGAAPWLDRLGAQMNGGRLIARGPVGDYSGFRMSGGLLEIDGAAGHFTGCEMRGGRLTVRGNS
ncbi:formyltransferase/hydrolase complex subunit C(FhcC), partial [Burkholderia sp. H160]